MENKAGYRKGNELEIDVWTGVKLTSRFSFSFRGQYQNIGCIQGQDNELHSNSDPYSLPQNYGSKNARIFAGIKCQLLQNCKSTMSLGVEGGYSVYTYV